MVGRVVRGFGRSASIGWWGRRWLVGGGALRCGGRRLDASSCGAGAAVEFFDSFVAADTFGAV